MSRAWAAVTIGRMVRPRLAVCLIAALVACSPALNWRELRGETGGLALQLPCKPDRGTRAVPMLEQDRTLTMTGCEADGLLLAVSSVDLGDATRANDALAGWQRAVRLQWGLPAQGALPGAAAFTPPGANALPQAERWQADVSGPTGAPMRIDAAWFARGSRVFHAIVIAPRGRRDGEAPWQPFFTELRVQPS